jgi:hypothetical protein
LDLSTLYRTRKLGIAEFALLDPKLPLLPPGAIYDNSVWMQNSSYIKYYRHSLIDLVVEPNLVGTVFNPTEKIARPILLKKPFIVMGASKVLDNLRKLGFKTFSDFWNEEYDDASLDKRYEGILDLIDTIAKLSDNEVMCMYHNMASILEHNYNLLTSGDFNVR